MFDTSSSWTRLNGTSNITENSYEKINFQVKTIFALYVPLLIVCLIGNILVCVTVMTNREMRSKRWYYFLINLAVADIGFALVTPMYAMQISLTYLGKCICRAKRNTRSYYLFYDF